jgi:hypothetical protein
MTDDETPLRLPAPPDDYSDTERAAFYAGARTYARAFRAQFDLVCRALNAGPVDEPPDTAADACPACEDGTIEQIFGTRRCSDCGHTPAPTADTSE